MIDLSCAIDSNRTTFEIVANRNIWSMNSNSFSPNRYMLIDCVRGLAIVLMVVYHFSWDLTYFSLADFDMVGDRRWIWFAKFIAGLILLVVGISHVMASQGGFRASVFLKRLLSISACAAIVSIATYQLDPNTFVYFGVLHHIALATILLMVVIRFPTPVLIFLGGVFFTGAEFLKLESVSPPWLAWSGLFEASQGSVDYLPLFPWFGIPLIAVVLGRGMLVWGHKPWLLDWRSTNPLVRSVCFAGRHSLLIYMVHQPVLFGALYATESLLK